MILIQLNKALQKRGYKAKLIKDFNASTLIDINTIHMEDFKIDENLTVRIEEKEINLWDMLSNNPTVKANFLNAINSLPKKEKVAIKNIILVLENDFRGYMEEVMKFQAKMFNISNIIREQMQQYK